MLDWHAVIDHPPPSSKDTAFCLIQHVPSSLCLATEMEYRKKSHPLVL